ncbi:altered inheritance of mitochondria protein 9 [Arthroderma uncinatum]|uniref:altered inheritance of mitochondria protein 9 n=1 Tax=Arthroderma uncinatum TaxID=74035 RepID=UPI00144AD00A|nr:altered inheritance of mitochondria protein 9 [Arthroderma uncinatum]KAF3480801.1 altered inheritance of mitochondria protein 9 [Arthroderma uncinatum]
MKPTPFPFLLNIGTDIVHIPRIQRLVARSVTAGPNPNTSQRTYLSRFVNRILCEQEQAYFKSKFQLPSSISDGAVTSKPLTAQTSTEIARWLAGRFAAKEAARKAAPGGASSISWKEVMVRAEVDGDGRPEVVYLPEGDSIGQIGKLSISHDGEYVVATVIAATPERKRFLCPFYLPVKNMRFLSRLSTSVRKLGARSMSTQNTNRELFEYTSGRFLFNEERRLAELRVQFNPDALAAAICRTVSRLVSDLTSITKLAEGGFNRVLQATVNDGYAVLARIPYHSMAPKHYAVAVKPPPLLHSHGLPVPKVLGYSPDRTNDIGVEYLLMEEMDGQPLGDRWFTIGNKTRAKIMKHIVQAEARFMSISLPASGSLYYKKDLGASESNIPLSE